MKYSPWVVIAILCIIIAIQNQCNRPRPTAVPLPPPRVDTVYKDTVIYKHDTPKMAGSSKAITIPAGYIPKKHYDSLLAQYNDVCAQLFTANYYQDSIEVDKSEILISDTVYQNKLINRGVVLKLHKPTVIVTQTLPQPNRRHVYAGGEISATNNLNGMQISGGLLYKNRRDNIVGASIGIDNAGRWLYTVKSYWKINLNRRP